MRSKMALLLELGVVAAIVAMLSGCFGDGATPNYDGTWTVVFADSAFTPPAPVSGATVSCGTLLPLPTVALANGVGSTTQTNRCNHIDGTGVIFTQDYGYNISVAITTSTGAVSAVVNGTPLTGHCISSVGCYAQAGTGSLNLSR